MAAYQQGIHEMCDVPRGMVFNYYMLTGLVMMGVKPVVPKLLLLVTCMEHASGCVCLACLEM